MDVQSLTVAGVTISGTEDEDPAEHEYFDGDEDVGELLDPLVDGAEADEMTKAKQSELDRIAEFGVYETVDIHARWEVDHRKDGIRARFVASEFKSDETMHDVFAPS